MVQSPKHFIQILTTGHQDVRKNTAKQKANFTKTTAISYFKYKQQNYDQRQSSNVRKLELLHRAHSHNCINETTVTICYKK